MPFYPKVFGSGGGGGGSPANPVWTKYSYNASDFSDASTSFTIQVVAGNKTVVNGVVVGIVTPFSGGSATSVQISLGTDTTSDAELSGGLEVLDVAGAAANDTQSTNTLQEVALYAPENITVTATAVGDSLDTLSGGSIEVWVLTSTLP